MPYTKDNPPEQIKELPAHAQDIWVSAFNNAWEQYDGDEERCNKVAWGAVKKVYEQDKDGNWVKLDEKLETVAIEGVEILAVGKWKGVPTTREYKEKDLDDLVDSFNKLTADEKLNYEPPVKLGHADRQKLLQEDGYPSAGWVSSLKRVGDKVVASFKDVPKKIADIIEVGGYKKVSSEIYHKYNIGNKTWPLVLKAVSLLGGDIPAVKTIADIRAQYGDGEENLVTVLYELSSPSDGEINLDEIYNSLDEWMGKAEAIIKGKVGSPAIRTFVREMKAKLKSLVERESKLAEDAIHPHGEHTCVCPSCGEKVTVEASVKCNTQKCPKCETQMRAESIGERRNAAEGEGASLDQKINAIRDAFYKQFQDEKPYEVNDMGWIAEVHEDYVIVDRNGEYMKIPYEQEEGVITFEIDKAVKVKRVWEELNEPSTLGKPGEPNKNIGEKEDVMLAEIMKLLKLDEEADVLKAVKSLVEKAEGKEELETTLAERDRDTRVAKAISGGKIAPAQKGWADDYALADPEGFDKFVEAQPVVVDLTELGSGRGEKEEVKLTDEEIAVADKMGVSREDLMNEKKEQQEGVS